MVALIETLEIRRLLSASTLVVNTLNDIEQIGTVTLRDAIHQANADAPGDIITFASGLSGGTIDLTQGVINITNSITINGLGANKLSISGENVSQIFIVDTGSTSLKTQVTITGITLTKGIAHGQTPDTEGGGAIYTTENLTLLNDVFTGNSATTFYNGDGGAIYNNGGTLNLTGDVFTGNTAAQGSGAAIQNNGTLVSNTSTFSGNTSVTFGGGGAVRNNGQFTSQGDVFSANTVQGDSGGAISNYGTMLAVKDSFINNVAGIGVYGFVGGGGIYNSGSLYSIGSTYKGNNCKNGIGGGILNTGNFISSNDSFSGNYGGEGGAIYYFEFSNQAMTITNDSINSNTAQQGGGIFVQGGAMVSSGNTFLENVATGGYNANYCFGGAVYYGPESANGAWNSTNDTFTANNAPDGHGGGIYAAGIIATTNDTIAGNFGGGVVVGNDYINGVWNSLNTIVAGNLAASGSATPLDVANDGATINAFSTLIGDPSSAGGIIGGTNGNIVGSATSAIFMTDSLGQLILSNNGGPTETIPIVANSLAIGTAHSLGSVTADDGNLLIVTDNRFTAPGDIVRIGNELVQVISVAGSNLVTVARGVNGTTQANLTGLPISLAYDQRGSQFPRTASDLGAVEIFTPIIQLNVPNYTYNGTAVPATATVTGVGGETINGAIVFYYYPTNVTHPLPTTNVPKNAGTYTVYAEFFSNINAKYTYVFSPPMTYTIKAATPTVSVTAPGGIYNGNPFPAKYTVSGIGGTPVSGTTTLYYYSGSTTGGQGSTTPPTQVGTYTVIANFVSSNPNYASTLSKPVTFKISPGAAAKLVFTAVPSIGSLNNGLTSAIVVSIEDKYGNVLVGNTTKVTLFIRSGPPGSMFSSGCSISAVAVNGVASFSNVKFTKTGTYTLNALGGGLPAIISSKIVIS